MGRGEKPKNVKLDTMNRPDPSVLKALRDMIGLKTRGRIQRKTWCMERLEPYTGVDYNLTLCSLQSRLQHNYHGQPYARVDFFT
jgi:hypothetical protein